MFFSMAMLDEKDDRRKIIHDPRPHLQKISELRNGKILPKMAKLPQFWLQNVPFNKVNWIKLDCKMQPDFLLGLMAEKIRAGRWKHPSSFTLPWWTRLHDASTGTEGFRGMGIWSWNLNIMAIQFIYCCNYLHIDTDGYGYICSKVGLCIYIILYIRSYIYWQFDIYIKFIKVNRWNTPGNQSRNPSSLCSASCDMKSVWRPQKIARQVIPWWDAEILTSLLVQPLSWMHSWLSGCLFVPRLHEFCALCLASRSLVGWFGLDFLAVLSLPCWWLLVTVGGFVGNGHWFAS